MRRFVIILLLALIASGSDVPRAFADDDDHHENRKYGRSSGEHRESDEDGHDQDRAQGAVQRGEIKSLVDVLMAIRDKLPGKVIGVELERKRAGWLYEFRVIDRNGGLFEVYVDGLTAKIVKIKRK